MKQIKLAGKINTVIVTSIVTTAAALSLNAAAENIGNIDFIGRVVSAPCNIAQSSLKQTVDFGQLSRRALENGRVAEVDFNIEFTGCDFTDFDKDNTDKPVAVKAMELTFTGQSYADALNTLLSTSPGNTNNVGIGIEGFEFGKIKDVLPRIINKKGNNTLTFKALAKAVDVSKEVSEGSFRATTNFRITYQ